MTATAATTVLQVDFKWQPRQTPTVAATPRLPRVVETLALAYWIEAMIAAGKLRDYVGAARLLGTTRARIAQITGLLLLAPAIQEAILELPPTSGRELVTERRLRPIVAERDWARQIEMWRRIHG